MSDSWWVLILFMYLFDEGFADRLEHEMAEQDADRRFGEWASNCTYLELENDGRATHHICRHPARDDPSDWVMCDRGLCPFMVMNASPEDMERLDMHVLMQSLNSCEEK